MEKVKPEHISKQKRELLEKARALPLGPGCYLMKNGDEKIIYIGKAKNLKNRVQSYFQAASNASAKTQVLVSHIRSFDFVVTQTEAEALILENNLIKKHAPKYNIRLKDDKSYPYVVVDRAQPFPRLQYLRKVKRGEGKEVFGPFAVGSHISQVMKILTKSFQLRDCTMREFLSRKEPCLLYQMRQCSAPCVQKISPENYEADLQQALNFLRGKPQKTLDEIFHRMKQAAENENFELAAHLRDHHQLLVQFLDEGQQKNAELPKGDENIDLVAFHIGEVDVDIALLMVRSGLLLGHKNFHFPLIDLSLGETSLEEEVVRFLMDYYSTGHDSLPQKLFVTLDKDSKELLQEGLKSFCTIKVRNQMKELKNLFDLTLQQASETQRFRLKNKENAVMAHLKLQELLDLEKRPKHLECYDIAIFQGTSPTAAQIVFEEGKPNKQKYRHYHLATRPEGNNDFAMMKEVITRRLKHGDFPDIFIVDGGLGQVNMFVSALAEERIDIPVIGIAKAKTLKNERGFQQEQTEKSQERLIIPGRSNAYPLSKSPPLLKLIVQMRDEAHRFSRRLHHKEESKRIFHSWLDDIEGIGGATRTKILKNLSQTPAEILETPSTNLSENWGVSLKIVEKIKKSLQKTS